MREEEATKKMTEGVAKLEEVKSCEERHDEPGML